MTEYPLDYLQIIRNLSMICMKKAIRRQLPTVSALLIISCNKKQEI